MLQRFTESRLRSRIISSTYIILSQPFRLPSQLLTSSPASNAPPVTMSASLAPECNEVKERYDTCFLKWYIPPRRRKGQPGVRRPVQGIPKVSRCAERQGHRQAPR
ncbi:hypothetical protein VFPFJ_02132 [Purpureocillium lilacinum]|uniref:Uncharacterized protein n=1 Tax=Purpureocillium lilacinum TaxID=33203 RepID=A0A179HTS5_PURLI|nr:hypothetical protein VFPFJ_02132 [Purpureocillium lilacinum]OAQ79274.1 hypothetical protein VFPBJ_07395 [Purpureocillium lilacinum]OAQ92971.1 hypothetical protein VFPFJ_02132 [Purpureocillium lilacinum]